MESEATPLWDQASPKTHVVAVDEGACIAMAIHHREIHSLTGGKWLPLQILRQTLLLLYQLSPLTGILLGEQLLHGNVDLAWVSTIPPAVSETQLEGFNEEMEVGGAIVLHV